MAVPAQEIGDLIGGQSIEYDPNADVVYLYAIAAKVIRGDFRSVARFRW